MKQNQNLSHFTSEIARERKSFFTFPIFYSLNLILSLKLLLFRYIHMSVALLFPHFVLASRSHSLPVRFQLAYFSPGPGACSACNGFLLHAFRVKAKPIGV